MTTPPQNANDTTGDTVRVTALSRHPVKGMSAEALDSTPLLPGEGLPNDRRFALARGTSSVDPLAPDWAPKNSFVQLNRAPKLSALSTRFDDETGVLTVTREGKEVCRAMITQRVGRAMLADFIRAFLKDDLMHPPKVVESPGVSFTDTREPLISVISEDSLKDLERVVGEKVDPRRFRANVMISGAPAWSEFDWAGGRIRIGSAVAEVVKPITRCGTINVGPEKGSMNLNLLQKLHSGFGHMDFGVYCRVQEGGRATIGDTIELV